MMPPPPSPSNLGRTLHAQQTQLEEEIRELRKRNAALEEELKTIPTGLAVEGQEEERQRIEALQAEVDRITEEAETLRSQLSASQAEAADASKLAQELQNNGQSAIDQLAEKERELAALRREMEIAAERAQSELDAGMDAKREEVRNLLERAEIAESEGAEMRALVEELTQAGQVRLKI
jgi:chromosome segregation ATPase